MRKLMLAAAMAAMLPSSAAEAQTSAATLSANDPKFDTPRCRAARQRMVQYAEKTGKDRFFIQSALFFALGSWVPPGTYDPTSQERAIHRDLQKYCVSRSRR